MAETIQLFVTCLLDSLFPEVDQAALQVLQRAGVEVEIPAGQTCCGQPAFNAGFRAESARMARRTLEVFEDTTGPVVIPSGSCAAMIRHGYLELFADEPAWLTKARHLASRTFELSEYLVDRLGVTALGSEYHARVAYHPSCHLLHGLGVDRQPMTLLEAVEGLQISRLTPECCGFGGVFSIQHGDISEAMLARKLAEIEASQAEWVVGCDVSCLMQIEGGLRKRGSGIRCMHLAQLLAGKGAGLR